MEDFSFWEEYKGASEGSGRSEKIWLINPVTEQTGLFKYKKDVETTDHVSECIAYELATLLEIPCAKFELGLYNGREGSISYNIIDNAVANLVEGVSFINLKYPKYNPEKFIDMETEEVYSLEMIKNSIEDFVDFADFLKIPIFDYLIGNTDRHQSNWAIIQGDGQSRISPLYDNSSSLCAYLSNKQIEGYLGNDLAVIEARTNELMNYPKGTRYKQKYSMEGFEDHLQTEFGRTDSFFTKRFLFLDMYKMD